MTAILVHPCFIQSHTLPLHLLAFQYLVLISFHLSLSHFARQHVYHTQVLNELFGITGEEYITKSDSKKSKLTNRLLHTPFLCVMKRTTWGASNTPSLAIVALKRPEDDQIFHGYKFADGAFVHHGRKIKQEKVEDNVNDTPPAKRRTKTKKKSAAAMPMDILSISDSDDNDDSSDSSSGDGDDNNNSDDDFVIDDNMETSSSDESSVANKNNNDDSTEDDSDNSSDDDDE